MMIDGRFIPALDGFISGIQFVLSPPLLLFQTLLFSLVLSLTWRQSPCDCDLCPVISSPGISPHPPCLLFLSSPSHISFLAKGHGHAHKLKMRLQKGGLSFPSQLRCRIVHLTAHVIIMLLACMYTDSRQWQIVNKCWEKAGLSNSGWTSKLPPLCQAQKTNRLLTFPTIQFQNVNWYCILSGNFLKWPAVVQLVHKIKWGDR